MDRPAAALAGAGHTVPIVRIYSSTRFSIMPAAGQGVAGLANRRSHIFVQNYPSAMIQTADPECIFPNWLVGAKETSTMGANLPSPPRPLNLVDLDVLFPFFPCP